MTIGPEPMRRIFRMSVRLGTDGLSSLLDQPVDDGDLRRGLLPLVEDVVDAAGAHPADLAAPPDLLAQHADALVHALAHRVGLQRDLALGGEARPLGLLSGFLGLAVRDQVFRHETGPPSISVTKRSNR